MDSPTQGHQPAARRIRVDTPPDNPRLRTEVFQNGHVLLLAAAGAWTDAALVARHGVEVRARLGARAGQIGWRLRRLTLVLAGGSAGLGLVAGAAAILGKPWEALLGASVLGLAGAAAARWGPRLAALVFLWRMRQRGRAA